MSTPRMKSGNACMPRNARWACIGCVVVTLALQGQKVAGGYRLAEGATATPELVNGLRALMGVLSGAG